MMSVALAVALPVLVTVDEHPMTQSRAVVRSGVAYVPIDDAVRAFDGVLIQNKHAATITIGYRTARFTEGNDRARFDGQSVRLAGTPYWSGGRLYVPLRFLARSVGRADVQYEAAHDTVAIETRSS